MSNTMTSLTEEQAQKYAQAQTNENFELPKNIWNLKKTPKTAEQVQSTEQNVENILKTELFPEPQYINYKTSKLRGIFSGFMKEWMYVWNYWQDSFKKGLNAIENEFFIPIRDIFTKDNIENILVKIDIMEENKTLSSKEKNIKDFFDDIDTFFENFEEKLKEIREYKYSNALNGKNKEFTNKVKELLESVEKAVENYKYFTDIFNKETTQKIEENKKASEITKNKDEKVNEEIENPVEIFKKLISVILKKIKK